jgi:hypothetical protein
MIARCKKGVVNKGTPVAFKTTHYAKHSSAYKAFVVVAVCGILSRGKRRGCNFQKKINCNSDCM